MLILINLSFEEININFLILIDISSYKFHLNRNNIQRYKQYQQQEILNMKKQQSILDPVFSRNKKADQDALRQKQQIEILKLKSKKFQKPVNTDSIDAALREIQNEALQQPGSVQFNQTIISGISSMPLSKLGMRESMSQLISKNQAQESGIQNVRSNSIMKRQDRRVSIIGSPSRDSLRIVVMTKKQQALLKKEKLEQQKKRNNTKNLKGSKLSKCSQLYGPESFIKRDRQSLWFGIDEPQPEKPIYNDIPFLVDENDSQTKKNLMNRNLCEGQVLYTNLKRIRKGINKLFPLYQLHSEDGIYLASAKKMAGNMTSNYHFSVQDDNFSVQKPSYIGKVRSNFLGDVFNVFTEGMNPKDVSDTDQPVRQLIATIYYNNDPKIKQVPREMQVYILEEGNSYSSLKGAPEPFKKQEISLRDLYQIGTNKLKISRFVNQKPFFDKKLGGYVLDLHGKKHLPSVKNLVLKRDSHPYEEVMLLAKVDDDEYHLDIAYPISPRIALGVLMSSFDFKICVQ